MTLSNNAHDKFIDELQAFIRNYRRKNAQCPDCGMAARRDGRSYKGKQKYECMNRRCKRSYFNEE